jgi:1-acyl-sn-glycerol-3-phosphate acyltransferase
MAVVLETPRLVALRRRDPLYRSVTMVALTTCGAMGWRPTIIGEEHIPAAGPAVIAVNHVGYLDFVFVGFAARRRHRFVRFMAMQEAFNHWLAGPLLRGMRHIPVDRKGDAGAALDGAIQALRGGEIVGIHPEGKVNRSLVLGPGKTGAARMALATGAPLIPAAVWGTQRLLAKGAKRRLPRNVPVTVCLGAPLDPAEAEDPSELTEQLMNGISALWRDAVTTYPQS